MLLLNLNRNQENPLYMQIVSQVKELVDNSVLKPDMILPSTRDLASNLGIHRATVYRAYQELWALGYLESRPGSYTRVRRRPDLATSRNRKDKGILDWDSMTNPSIKRIYLDYKNQRESHTTEQPDVINLGRFDMDDRIFPADEFRQCMNRVLRKNGSRLLQYGELHGYKLLRKYIAERLQIHGVSVTRDEILITSGSQQAIDLVLKLFAGIGRKAIIEEPTYSYILPLLAYYNIEVCGIPMNSEGMDLNALEEKLKNEKAAFVFTMPNFHNPTGITTTQSHREKLLNLCNMYGVPLVEDGFEEEMKYYGKVALPIKSMDGNNVVIYLGTFSKVLFPGLRIGWIAADTRLVERLTGLKRFIDISTNTPVQAALYEFCRQGYYDIHIKRMHRIYRKRMQTALTALKRYMPAGISWTEPCGGYLIWVQLNNIKCTKAEFEKILLENRVIVSPGEYYFYSKPSVPTFRISISTLNEQEIEEGIKRFGKGIAYILQRRNR